MIEKLGNTPSDPTIRILHDKINEIIDTLSKPSVEVPSEPIYYDCTLAKFAEQLDVPLWKAMEFGKYFKPSMPSVQQIEDEVCKAGNWETLYSEDIDTKKIAQAIYDLLIGGK